jgi:hypothetical protein
LYDFPVKVFGPYMLSLIVYLVFFFTRRGFPKITGNNIAAVRFIGGGSRSTR